MKKVKQIFVTITLLLIITSKGYSQTYKRICVMGSSTAYGYFGNPPLYPRDSAWAFRVKKYYKDAGIIDTLFDIAVLSTDCYSGMPTGYTPPPGRNQPDTNHNITKAIHMIPKPDVIIVNYPNNNYDWLSNDEILECLETIKETANANNIACFITTTQPRNNFSPSERQKLKDLSGLIKDEFDFWAIDFWSGIVLDPPIIIDSIYSLGDGIHLNPAGHQVLAQQVIAKNVFNTSPLATEIEYFHAYKQENKIQLTWSANNLMPGSFFNIERSNDGVNFSSIKKIGANNIAGLQQYAYTDPSPAHGYNYYYISFNHNGVTQFSPVEKIYFGDKLQVSAIYPSVSTNKISFSISSSTEKHVQFIITDPFGRTFNNSSVLVNNRMDITKDISYLPAGLYYITITAGNEKFQRKFIKTTN